MKHLRLLALLTLAVPAALAQDTAPVVTEAAPVVAEATPVPAVEEGRWSAEERLSRATELIDAPLSVNGVAISAVEIRRQLVLKVGRTQLESRKLDLMIEVELADRERLHYERMAQLAAKKAAGEVVDEVICDFDRSVFELTPEESQKAYDDAVAAIKKQYPNMAVEDVLASNSLNLVGLQRSLAAQDREDTDLNARVEAAWARADVHPKASCYCGLPVAAEQ